MQDLESFLAMGGYAAFVWPAIALTLAVLIWLAWISVRKLRDTQKRLEALEDLGRQRKRGRGRGE
ncbi:MAG: heme exporter protein CcmD [Rhodospirillales bacterium]|nr:heme exporter protein CcmD [Rhodospirillales bacterium]